MDSNMTIKDLLQYKTDDMRHKLGLDLCHPTSQGDLSETAWIAFLQSFLPTRYAVSKGFVFDSRGQISDQIDVIIYDRYHSPLIFETPNGEKYITAESVYAIFEVKQKANKRNLGYAQEKIKSVRKLYRTSRGMICAGKPTQARDLTNIIGGLLCNGSVGTNSLRNEMRNCSSIDMVCAASAATFFRSADEIMISCQEEALPAFFYLLLDELFKLGTVPAIDIREYAKLALTSFHLKGTDDVAK